MDDDDDDDEDNDDGAGRHGGKAQQAPARAAAAGPSKRRQRPHAPFESDASDEEEDDEEGDEEEEDDDEHADRSPRPRRAAAASRRRSEESDVDDDDDDDGDGANDEEASSQGEEEEEADDEEEGFHDDNEDAEYVEANGEDATDEITGDLLQHKHVVWRSPDGSSTLRFNLSTLRKIATRAGGWRAPPHFRSAMDDELSAQIRAKFGEGALRPVWNDERAVDGEFFVQLAEWNHRRLSDVYNLYACPICLLWLRGGGGGGGGSGGSSSDGAGGGGSSSAADAEADAECPDVDLDAPYDPIHVLFGAPKVGTWHAHHGLPPEAAAAQCCFRKQAELTAHMRSCHCCSAEQLKFVKERLPSYQLREGDGLVHRFVGSRLHGRGAPSEGHVRKYWVESPECIGTGGGDEEEWFSRASLYLALYAEVEAQARGEGHASSPAEALFGGALAAPRRNGSGPNGRAARPIGWASKERAEGAMEVAWEALGFAGGDDDLDDWMAGSDESGDDGGGGDDGMHMAMHLSHQLGGDAPPESEEEDDDDGEEGEEEGEEEGGEEDSDAGGRVPHRESGADEQGEEGEEDEEDDGEEIEYYSEPDALELAERALKERKRARRGRAPSAASSAGASSSAEQAAAPKRRRTTIQESDDDDE